MIPVQELNFAQDCCSESDSGLRIDANIVTVVPECPAYGWYSAQSPARVADPPPPPPVLLELLEQAATRASPRTAGATISC
ncbi:hypothetical protein GCM10009738_70500 [Kitasatospora viridis]